ncbi:twin-arginine translocation signal domain-containing protein [Streptomyces sp. NPDC051636]
MHVTRHPTRRGLLKAAGAAGAAVAAVGVTVPGRSGR